MDVFEALRESPGALAVSAADIEALFTRDDAVTALFFAGERDRTGESADVAVVLRELVRCHAGRLRAGVMEAADERKLKALFGVSTTPSLVFVRGRATLGAIERMKGWDQYAAQVVEILDGGDATRTEATLQ
jgi:hypothetical protein